jgi:hypothetical protein
MYSLQAAPEALVEFIAIYKRVYGVELETELARTLAEKLLSLMIATYKN